MRNPACKLELIERELCAFIPCVEALRAQVDCIGAVRDCSAYGVE